MELNLDEMQHRYEIRAALDGLAARGAAMRAKGDEAFAAELERRGGEVLSAGQAAVAESEVPAQIRHDEAFHNLIYEASGNLLLARTAEPHWRYLRRTMGEVLRHAEPPPVIWRQHREILDAVAAGDPELAEERAVEHVWIAAATLRKNLGTSDVNGEDWVDQPAHDDGWSPDASGSAVLRQEFPR